MAHELEYVVKDALMTCDKGAAPGFFRPTYNMTTKINGCLVTTDVDKKPTFNIPSFGVCAATQKPCLPLTSYSEWQKTYKVKVHGAKTLLFRSCIMCSAGGKIEFATSGQIPLPQDALDDIEKMQEQGAKEEESGFGWLDAVEMIPVVGSIVGAVREGLKGNWGMMAANIGFLAMDVLGVVTGGTTTIAATVAKTSLKAGVKIAAKTAVKTAAKQVGKSGLKTGLRLSGKGALKAFRNNIDNVVGKASKGKLCVFACFPAGTPVHTEFGVRNIEEVKVGDKVWSFDEESGETALKEVVQTMVREADVTLKLKIGDETIETTAEHPFYTQDGWKDAADLETSDNIRRKDNCPEKLISAEYDYNPKKVFNFEVADWHTYFVGAWAWLVHNAKACASSFVRRLPKVKGKWIGEAGNSIWKSTKEFVNKITKGEGVPFKGGYPDFSKWSKGRMKFSNLDGTPKDFNKVYERIMKQKGLKSQNQAKKYLKQKGLTPHHHQDGKTIELIPTELHRNIPHSGGASLLRNGQL